MSRQDPASAAREIIAERFSGANAVLLSGSVMRGEGTETSDLETLWRTTDEAPAK